MTLHRFRLVIWGFVAVNLAGLLLFLACWAFAAMLAPMGPNARVTELDRAGVIDHEKLKAHDPALAANVRYNLGPWIAGPEPAYAARFAAFGAALAGVNLVLAAVAIVRAERASAPGGAEEGSVTPGTGDSPLTIPETTNYGG